MSNLSLCSFVTFCNDRYLIYNHCSRAFLKYSLPTQSSSFLKSLIFYFSKLDCEYPIKNFVFVVRFLIKKKSFVI